MLFLLENNSHFFGWRVVEVEREAQRKFQIFTFTKRNRQNGLPEARREQARCEAVDIKLYIRQSGFQQK
jgi:hypothetical protein